MPLPLIKLPENLNDISLEKHLRDNIDRINNLENFVPYKINGNGIELLKGTVLIPTSCSNPYYFQPVYGPVTLKAQYKISQIISSQTTSEQTFDPTAGSAFYRHPLPVHNVYSMSQQNMPQQDMPQQVMTQQSTSQQATYQQVLQQNMSQKAIHLSEPVISTSTTIEQYENDQYMVIPSFPTAYEPTHQMSKVKRMKSRYDPIFDIRSPHDSYPAPNLTVGEIAGSFKSLHRYSAPILTVGKIAGSFKSDSELFFNKELKKETLIVKIIRIILILVLTFGCFFCNNLFIR
ncbi:hypothetical protein F8M41_023382 [Gigaspora margarita]|uniref:Uncharacterized protein n=1 Tax=Gigaspora margarita TaxID=4874 RepID=A0A8H4ADG9_GIGMA|nr:hypothetical protein F8M41_023382 [Gigaspora margarita]